jgi:uncharacterized repeat protein (TIGR01451 family)
MFHPRLVSRSTLMTLHTVARRLFHVFLHLIALCAFTTWSAGTVQAQTIYGVGVSGTTTVVIANSTALFSVNANTGAATPICTLSGPSTANAVSSLDGLIYYITREATARLIKIDPSTCTNTVVGNTTLGNNTLRSTFCPDGRMYAMSSTAQFFEINSSTGATNRTLTWTGLPTGGSGDFACTSTGDMYIIAQDAVDTPYNIYSATGASFAAVASGSNVAASNVGDLGLGGIGINPNGLTEAPAGLAGCASAPLPCLMASTGGTNQTWRINVSTGSVTATATTSPTGHGLTDLSRSFPVDLSFSKTVTPSIALQGQTVVYRLTVSNPGPAVVSQITVTDVLSAAFSSATWSCSIANAGSATLVPTSCGPITAGTGNINNTVTLSINGSVVYNITATLTSTFTGTLTNAGQAAMTSLVTDPTPGNNAATVTSTVAPATSLSITKTNGIGTVTAGQTVSYTVTVSNLGPGDAPNSIVKDPVAAGLSCTAATCTVTSGTATCPTGLPSVVMAALQGAGAALPTFNAGSTVSFLVTCGVTATGQ